MNNELIPPEKPASALPAMPQAQETTEQPLLFTPPIDIYESEAGLVLVADLPGVTLENLELQVQDNKLTLFGRVNPYVPEGAMAQHTEYGVGDFLRSFILSDEVDHENISAKLSQGVLKVILPKAKRSEPRKIDINEGE